MSVNTIAYDGGGFGQWRSRHDFRNDPPIAWQATSQPQPARNGAGATTSNTAGSPGAPAWLSATEGAASTLITDLQAFLVDLQAIDGGGTSAAGTNAGTAAANADTAQTQPTTASTPTATDPAAAAGTTTTAAVGIAANGATTPGTGTTTGNDATNLVNALQSFIAALDGEPTGQSAPLGTTPGTTAAAPAWNGWHTRGGGWRHHHGGGGSGGSGGLSGELHTTNQLLGQILGVLGGYAGQGNQGTTPPAAITVSA